MEITHVTRKVVMEATNLKRPKGKQQNSVESLDNTNKFVERDGGRGSDEITRGELNDSGIGIKG